MRPRHTLLIRISTQDVFEMQREVERLRKELQSRPDDFRAAYNLAAGAAIAARVGACCAGGCSCRRGAAAAVHASGSDAFSSPGGPLSAALHALDFRHPDGGRRVPEAERLYRRAAKLAQQPQVKQGVREAGP